MHSSVNSAAPQRFMGWVINRFSSDTNPFLAVQSEWGFAWTISYGSYRDFSVLNARDGALLPLALSFPAPRTAIICC